MLVSLLLPSAFAWSVLAGPFVSLSSFNKRHPSKAFNEPASNLSFPQSNTSSQMVNPLVRHLPSEYIGCFERDPSFRPPHQQPTYVDCLNVAWHLKMDAVDPTRSRNFSRHPGDPDHDYLVPSIFAKNSCVVYVDVIKENDHDMLSMTDLAKTALEIAEDCVKKRPHLGGTDVAGPQRVIQVIVMGAPELMIGTANVA